MSHADTDDSSEDRNVDEQRPCASEESERRPFGPAFFIRHLAAFARDRCPELNSIRFAIATATAWSVAGVLCGVFYIVAPEQYAAGANFLLHSDMFTSTRALGWPGLVGATAVWWIMVAIIAGSAAALYNWSLGAAVSREG